MPAPPRLALAAVLVLLSAASRAAGQTASHELTLPDDVSPDDVRVSASGTHVAVVTGAAILPDDVNGHPDVYLYDVTCRMWSRTTIGRADAFINLIGLSGDGHMIGYASRAWDTAAEIRRYDTATATSEAVVALPASGFSSFILTGATMSRDGSTFAYHVLELRPTIPDPTSLWTVRVGAPADGPTTICSPAPFSSGPETRFSPALTQDGSHVAYRVGCSQAASALVVSEIGTGAAESYPEIRPTAAEAPLTGSPTLDVIALPAGDGSGGVFDRRRRQLDPLVSGGVQIVPMGISDDGALVLGSAPTSLGREAVVYDRSVGLRTALGHAQQAIALSSDGTLAVTYVQADPSPPVLTVWALDHDADGMLDPWETAFGLDPTSATDAALDANGDGLSNLEAYEQRLHPTAIDSADRLFAEGATGFFETHVSLFNPGPLEATAMVRLLGAAGQRGARVIPLTPGARAEVRAADLPGFSAAEFALAIDSNRPLVAERRMSWPAAAPYAMHASSATAAPARTWYFAEGATIAGLQTFVLLQNPSETAADVTLEFLLQPSGHEVRRTMVAPQGRTTVWVNQEGGATAHGEFATIVRSDVPIVAERAMYRDAPGQMFAAGTNAVGVTTPGTSWLFAEGAVGPFFDMFVLVANPGETAATVTATFRPEGHAAFARTFTVPALGRYTVWVDQEGVPPGATAVSVALTSSAPIVAERVMWWPGDASTWNEGHVEVGATDRGVRFAVADAEIDTTTTTDTFLLVDVDTLGLGTAPIRLTAYPGTGAPVAREITAGDGRHTLWLGALLPELNGQRFAASVETLDVGGIRAQISVEKAVYRYGFRMGTATLATRLD